MATLIEKGADVVIFMHYPCGRRAQLSDKQWGRGAIEMEIVNFWWKIARQRQEKESRELEWRIDLWNTGLRTGNEHRRRQNASATNKRNLVQRAVTAELLLLGYCRVLVLVFAVIVHSSLRRYRQQFTVCFAIYVVFLSILYCRYVDNCYL